MEAAALRKDLRGILVSASSPVDLSAHGITQANLSLLHKPFRGEVLLSLVPQTLEAPQQCLKIACSSVTDDGKVQWID